MKKKATKRALLMSVLSLLLCIGMLVGTTLAWFTDSVVSANNIIKSGNLDVELYWADGTKALPADDTGWNDASSGAIFDYDKWEPGYTEVRHIRIANKGSLALSYKVRILAEGTVTSLSDVIDVYYVDPAVQIEDRDALNDANKLGTLTEVLAKLGETGSGTLLANTADTVTIALKMQESAGNEFKETSIGSDFRIQLHATQLTHESDSFGPEYDAEAAYTEYVSNAEELRIVLDDIRTNAKQTIPGENGNKQYRVKANIVLTDDIVIDNPSDFMYTDGNGAAFHLYGMSGVLDLNGHDIKVSSDALLNGKAFANAVLLIQYSNVSIKGNGSIIAENQSIPVYAWANCTVNIYGGTYITNATQRNESAVYVNNASASVNVYGGTYTDSAYAFNAHDKSCGSTPVITLHEGITYADFFKGTTDLTKADITAGRIVFGENCILSEYEENGVPMNKVVKN